MKKKLINNAYIEGYLYESNLEEKISGDTSKNPGVPYMRGSISVATDEDFMNIVKISYMYEAPTFKNGKENSKFETLKSIKEGKIKSVMADGKDVAAKVSVNSAMGLNEWFDDKNEDKPISVQINQGGFITVESEFKSEKTTDRDNFEADIVITHVELQEADIEHELPERVKIKGAIFDFRGVLLPYEFTAQSQGAMNYFLGLEASNSNPVFTKIKGHQVSYVTTKEVTEESAFGEASVREVKSTHKNLMVTWAAAEAYVWDTPDTMLASEFAQKIQERQIALATMKKDREEYSAKSNATSSPAKANAIPSSGDKYIF